VQNERSLNGKKVIYLKSVIPNIFGLKTLILFFYWFHFSILLAVFTFFRGSWWNSLMFAESIKAKIIQLTEKRYLANEYLFNISGMMYRPLWTYSAEEKGAKITMYFYSTNCEGFKSPNKNYEISYMYKIMSWTNYLVWDLYQATFVKKAVGTDVNIEIVGPIWFTSSKEKLPSYQLRSIVVFDVQPVRDIYYQSLGLNVEYYTPEICGQFLEDITMVLNKFNISIVHKRKRQIGKLAHYKYRNLLKELSKNKNYFTVDSNIAPQNIIQNSIAVISMPFTSTAIIGSHMHKPTIFYDPTGLVLKDDEAAHGIEIISGKNSLENWVKQILI
jgi:polysaccharide biosynthesis PFTS motif protein